MLNRSALVALSISLLLAGCTQTVCEPTSLEPTGDLAVDLVGSWDGFGVDSRLVQVYDADGAWRQIEPPNQYAPSGLQSSGTWSISGDVLTYRYSDGGTRQAGAAVTATELTVTWGIDQGSEYDVVWTRSECTGYGF